MGPACHVCQRAPARGGNFPILCLNCGRAYDRLCNLGATSLALVIWAAARAIAAAAAPPIKRAAKTGTGTRPSRAQPLCGVMGCGQLPGHPDHDVDTRLGGTHAFVLPRHPREQRPPGRCFRAGTGREANE